MIITTNSNNMEAEGAAGLEHLGGVDAPEAHGLVDGGGDQLVLVIYIYIYIHISSLSLSIYIYIYPYIYNTRYFFTLYYIQQHKYIYIYIYIYTHPRRYSRSTPNASQHLLQTCLNIYNVGQSDSQELDH